jgi:hypothetical protein
MKLKKSRAYYMYEERTGNTLLAIEFEKNLGGMDFVMVDSDLAENAEKVRQALKKKGAQLTGPKAKQLKTVNTLLANIEPNTRQLAMKPGFRGAGFVLGETMLGAAKDTYVYRAIAGKPDIGQHAGSRDGWNNEVAPLVAQSSFATVAVFIALAAPLVTYVNQHLLNTTGLSPILSETAVMNFSGDSRVGKTTLSRVAAGISGSPDAIFKWDFSRAGLEVLAEKRNDLVMVLDDIEKFVEIEMTLKNAMRLVGQVIPSGQSKALSDVARDNGSPERRWTTFGISSSPLPLDVLAERMRWTRTLGEKVRFIDVPLPKGVDAGIFDRLPDDTEDQVAAGTALITDLERGVALHFGHIMQAWIEYLLAENRALQIQEYTKRFVVKVAADGTGYDKCYAEKFGILYAAGKLATEAGILLLPEDLPWKAVRCCYRLALASAAPAEVRAAEKIELLIRLFDQKKRFPKIATVGSQIVTYCSRTLGVRTVVNGKPVCAMRTEELRAFAGSALVAKAMRSQMAPAGVLMDGQGSSGASQVGIKIKVAGKTSKPRFWVMNEKKLRSCSTK